MTKLIVTALRGENKRLLQHWGGGRVRHPTPQSRFYTFKNGNALLQTGMGLQRAREAIRAVIEAQSWDACLLMGVSGGVGENQSIGSIVRGVAFQMDATPQILHNSWEPTWYSEARNTLNIEDVTFRSCIEPVTDADNRARVQAGGAQAVDMESYEILRACLDANIPFISVRIISDQAGIAAFEEFKKHYPVVADKLQVDLIPYLDRWN